MGAPRKADWRKQRRKRAWNLKEQGWKQKDIAVALGVSEDEVLTITAVSTQIAPRCPHCGAPAKSRICHAAGKACAYSYTCESSEC